MKYREDYEKNKTAFTPVETNADMEMSKALQPVLSKQKYAEGAKQIMPDVHVGTGTKLICDIYHDLRFRSCVVDLILIKTEENIISSFTTRKKY